MAHYKGRIVEILLESYQNAAARLHIPREAEPRPGQYLQAHCLDDPLEVVPSSIFRAGGVSRGAGEQGSLRRKNADALENGKENPRSPQKDISIAITGLLPAGWRPGTELHLRGPLGRGFEVPRRARRLALVALDRNPSRLLPLVVAGLNQGAEIALFSDGAGGNLPPTVEQQTLKELSLGVKWADYLAVDISIEKIDELETIFRSQNPAVLAAEILVSAPMPCGGLAKCGVCTVHTKNGPQLACEVGPVFDLRSFVFV